MLRFLSEKENTIVLIGIVLSFFNWILATAFCVLLLLYLKQGIRGGIKALIIMGIRTNIGTSIAASIGSGGPVKFAVIFIIAFYIIANAKPHNPDRLSQLSGLLLMYLVSNVITLLLKSSYPITGLFKVISYAIPFYAVLKGVGDDDRYDYIEYMVSWFTVVVLASVVAIPIGRFNSVNGDFQGILNHPNTWGLFGGVFVGLSAYQLANGKITTSKWFRIACIVLALFMLYLSKSRTGMFSALIFIIVAFMTATKMNMGVKIILGFLGCLLIAVYVGAASGAMDAINQFVFKRGETTFLQSRDEMKIAYEYKHAVSPWLGTGFLVPFYNGIRDWSLSFSLIAEPGNLYYAVVGDSGTIGAVLFVLYIGYIVLNSGKRKIVLALIPLVISMGEVAFFSTNNVAAWYYVLYGICLSYDGDREVSFRQYLPQGLDGRNTMQR